MRYYLKGNYYFDIDLQNQLRIAGPQNHLLLGISFPADINIDVVSSEIVKEELLIELTAQAEELSLTIPLVTDMRTLRSHVEPVIPTPTYNQLVEKGIVEVLPQKIDRGIKDGKKFVSFKNIYNDQIGQELEYGALVAVNNDSDITLENNYLKISGQKPITIWIETKSNVFVEDSLQTPIFQASAEMPSDIFPNELLDLYSYAGEHIEHLIKTKKTSGFEYGTIFPRDWIESADLGYRDLSQDTIDYMYRQSMKYISETGEAWHEDLVGQYRSKIIDQSLHIDRKMIDIEPKYLLGFRVLSTSFLMTDAVREKLKLVGNYIINLAEQRDLITFKEVANEPDQYQFIGNWRDSYHAFPRQKSPLAPYDVNCVLYPEVLQIIHDHKDYFEVDSNHLEQLILKWRRQKEKFRLYHPGDVIGYSLALHGKKRIPLPIAHTDEAYDLFYGSPSMEEVISFSRKIMSGEFFYTPVGPTLVALDEEDFSIRHYHGKVIWPKQTAFCVGGLTRQYLRGVAEAWPEQVVEEIKQAALTTAETSFRAFVQLQAIPELYYYDEETDAARFYTDQAEYEGQMSVIQLWSSVGFRRIARDYATLHGYQLATEQI